MIALNFRRLIFTTPLRFYICYKEKAILEFYTEILIVKYVINNLYVNDVFLDVIVKMNIIGCN